MNDDRLEELREKYKDRNLLEELGWGTYANHSGYTSKANGEFINWLCNAAYRALKQKEREINDQFIRSRTLYDQIKWERDIAIAQLEEAGLRFCGKEEN